VPQAPIVSNLKTGAVNYIYLLREKDNLKSSCSEKYLSSLLIIKLGKKEFK
jgi:hypothetical protein